MDCRQFEQLLDEYLDGDLKGTFKGELEAHVVECGACGHLLAMMQAVGQIITEPGADEPKLDRAFTDKVLFELQLIRDRKRRWYRFVTAASAAAAVIVLVASLIHAIAPTTTPTRSTSEPTVLAQANDILSLPPGNMEPLGTLDEQTRTQMELRGWLVATLEQTDLAIGQFKRLPTLALDEIGNTFMDSVAGRHPLAGPVLSVPSNVHPAGEFRPDAIPTEALPVEADSGWI